MNQFGRRLRLSIFGESHGPGVGITLDGVPPGTPIDLAQLAVAMAGRRPGGSALVSSRQETDKVEILSGVRLDAATGAPLTLWIPNMDARSESYADNAVVPRPGHADFVNHAWSKGFADLRGGGHSSGRLTAPLVAAAAIVQPILDAHGVDIGAHLQQVHTHAGPPGVHEVKAMDAARARPIATAHQGLEGAFIRSIEEARANGDSVGGVVEFAAEGLPVGLGDPLFDSLESQLSHLLFSVPAVKGVSFGAGFQAAAMTGSQHNDPFALVQGAVRTTKNDAGGIVGGRSNGEHLWGHCAFKPASSIAKTQQTLNLATKESVPLAIAGRHDPCVAVRAVPVVAACVKLAVADALLLARLERS